MHSTTHTWTHYPHAGIHRRASIHSAADLEDPRWKRKDLLLRTATPGGRLRVVRPDVYAPARERLGGGRVDSSHEQRTWNGTQT